MNLSSIAFIGGGNMASAIIGGLLKAGRAAATIQVVEPFEAQRQTLVRQFGVGVHPSAGAALSGCELVVWAVKPSPLPKPPRLVPPTSAARCSSV